MLSTTDRVRSGRIGSSFHLDFWPWCSVQRGRFFGIKPARQTAVLHSFGLNKLVKRRLPKSNGSNTLQGSKPNPRLLPRLMGEKLRNRIGVLLTDLASSPRKAQV